MSSIIPRMRMFAGPNGSGKSSLKMLLPPVMQGIYLNPDEMEKALRDNGWLDFEAYEVSTDEDELVSFFINSELLVKTCPQVLGSIRFIEGRLFVPKEDVNSYLASVLASFLRSKLLLAGVSFTFETVMSSPDKVKLLSEAQDLGYRTYLYYVATDDPLINISRVRVRVELGGHSVPEDKIVSRYYRSLKLLPEAIKLTHRAYIFDNSSERRDHTWLAEVTDGRELEIKSDRIPQWFQHAVLDVMTDES